MASWARILGGHIATGLMLGFILGVVYFALDPLRFYWERYEYLGAPLLGVLGVYVVSGGVFGIILSAVVGGFDAMARRWVVPERFVALYLVLMTFLLVVMYVTRNYSKTRLKSLAGSKETLVFAVVLIVLSAAGIALSRWFSRGKVFRGLTVRWVLAGVFVCVICAVALPAIATYQENYLPPSRAGSDFDGPNVVVIVLDAFRADHMAAYGYDRNTTPTMDRLAREGVMFLNAHSHGNRTVISMPSVFTSLYPAYHGVIGHGRRMRGLPGDRVTIAEVFSERGYTTVGLMNNVYLKNKFGLVRGFDRVVEYYYDRYNLGLYKALRHVGCVKRPRFAMHRYPDADEVTDAGVRWLRNIGDRPFFLYVHYMDTHHPYAPPPPYDTMFGKDRPGDPAPMALYKKTTQMISRGERIELADRELEKLRDYYDGSIRFADDEIGRLLGAVDRLNPERETIVVITADHGDEFLEHGSLYHTNLVIEELIHVPLVVWSSKGFARGARIDTPVRHIDLMPTLADLIGSDTPPQAMGRSLARSLENGAEPQEHDSIAEGDFCASLNRGHWKIMRVDSTNSWHLYDLRDSPREKIDRSGENPGVYQELYAKLRDYLEKARTVKESGEGEVDEETIRQLKALGYL